MGLFLTATAEICFNNTFNLKKENNRWSLQLKIILRELIIGVGLTEVT
jgi:hypothetical protein